MWQPMLALMCVLLSGGAGARQPSENHHPTAPQGLVTGSDKASFIDALISKMTVADLVLQIHLTFGADLTGPKVDNQPYDHTMRFSPNSSVGVIHDIYPVNISYYNSIQDLVLEKGRLKIPFMHVGECLHGVGSQKQSMFPQSLGLSASFDTDLVYRVGRAIGTEARSIGIHACFSPVLDLGLDPRWGRMQEAWGEDKVLTSHMGVAYSSGLSKNGSWSEPDAVAPVMKHFAAHGSPQGGHNAAPFIGHGNRQLFQDLLMPFKAAVQLGGVKGVMMAYNEFDDIPAAVNPTLYKALDEWGFDGFVVGDDIAVRELHTEHHVADSPADALSQWFNAGGMLQFYDYPLEVYLNTTKDLVANGSVQLITLQSHARRILGLKWDLGLFKDAYIPAHIDPEQIVSQHRNLTLEAAQRSIVLLENRNATLPLKPTEHKLGRIALVGPFADVPNYGDYSGALGQCPDAAALTLREGLLNYTKKHGVELVSSWGSNSWEYNAQYIIPPYLLSSANGTRGGLLATYYADTNFTHALVQKMEMPALNWGLYPPPGLPSSNFSAVWEGSLQSPVDVDDLHGWLGIGIGPNSTVKLLVDDVLVITQGLPQLSTAGTTQGNIMPYSFIQANSTLPPPGAAPFVFRKGVSYRVRIEFQAYNFGYKAENVASTNSELNLFWNLVDSRGDRALESALELARTSDLTILAVGAGWNSDGEGGDRGTLGLAPCQDRLARALYALGKPVVLVLQGGRPFGLGDLYDRSAAVLSAWFPGQSGGQAVADVLFGAADPAGRMPVTVPRHVGQLPLQYNRKAFAARVHHLDLDPTPHYWFGAGGSYANFSLSSSRPLVATSGPTFRVGDTVHFSVTAHNIAAVRGSYVAQLYLLGRTSSVVQPQRQLVAFGRVNDVAPGAEVRLELRLDVDRYLTILNRAGRWELEKGAYTFALLEHGGVDAPTDVNVTLTCV